MKSSMAKPRILATIVLAGAVLAFAPGSALAQHGGGGGGHVSGGGGGHFGGASSSHPSSASRPAPARSAPATSRPAASSKPAANASFGNAVAHVPYFGRPASGSSGSPTTFVMRDSSAGPRNSVIGFPPADSHVAAVDPSVRTSSGALSFSGQGHQIWQDSSSGARSSALSAAPASGSGRAFFGQSSPSFVTHPTPPHRVFGPVYSPPYFYGSAYGFYPGYYGAGLCSPYWGFDPGFGCGGLGFGYGFGYGFGSGYPGYFGFGYDGSYSVGATTSPSVYENDTPDDSANSYAPAPEQGTDGSSATTAPAPPAATLIYLKDGTSYEAMSYWLDTGKLHYITNYGGETSVDMSQLDLQRTVDENHRLGIDFTLRPSAPAPPQSESTPDSQPAAPQQ
jgi:hypothetical protein